MKADELQVRRLEAAKAIATMSAPWWRRADPLVVAIFAGALTLLGNMAVAIINNYDNMQQEQKKAADNLALEKTKARYSLVLQAMTTSDAALAKRNIHFFIDAGLLPDEDCRIREALDQDQPVLPALSGTAPVMPAGLHSAPEIATLYNFPSGLDGRGVTVGILELAGNTVAADITTYFKSLNLPPPDIESVLVDGAEAKADEIYDAQVMLDVEIIGAIAPRAKIRLYFAPFTSTGIAHAITRAVQDGVSVFTSGWGKPESQWKDEELSEIDSALEQAAHQHMTILAGAANGGGGRTGESSSIFRRRVHGFWLWEARH